MKNETSLREAVVDRTEAYLVPKMIVWREKVTHNTVSI